MTTTSYCQLAPINRLPKGNIAAVSSQAGDISIKIAPCTISVGDILTSYSSVCYDCYTSLDPRPFLHVSIHCGEGPFEYRLSCNWLHDQCDQHIVVTGTTPRIRGAEGVRIKDLISQSGVRICNMDVVWTDSVNEKDLGKTHDSCSKLVFPGPRHCDGRVMVNSHCHSLWL